MTPNLRLHLSTVALIFSGMLAGVLSSAVYISENRPEMVLPGLVLGGLLSVGISLINYGYKENLNRGIPPRISGVLWYSALVGVLAAISMRAISATAGHNALSQFNSWVAACVSLVYIFTLLPLYYARFFDKKNLGIILLKVGLLGLLAGFFLLIIAPVVSQGRFRMGLFLEICFLIAVYKVIPFICLWYFSVYVCDPAFTLARWQRTTGNVKADADAPAETL